MARARMLRPDFLERAERASISRDAQYLAVLLPLVADDDGRILDSPKKIAGEAFPLECDVSAEMAEKWLGELASAGWIHRYSAEGRKCIFIDRWYDDQKIGHPAKSTLPAPPEDLMKSSEQSHECLTNSSRGRGETFTPKLREVKSREENSSERGARRRTFPEDFEVTSEMRAWAEANTTDVNVDKATESFIRHHKAKGTKAVDFVPLWEDWLSKEHADPKIVRERVMTEPHQGSAVEVRICPRCDEPLDDLVVTIKPSEGPIHQRCYSGGEVVR